MVQIWFNPIIMKQNNVLVIMASSTNSMGLQNLYLSNSTLLLIVMRVMLPQYLVGDIGLPHYNDSDG